MVLDDPWTMRMGDAIERVLEFNGGPAVGANFKRFNYPGPDPTAGPDDPPPWADAVDAELAFKPHIVIVAGLEEGAFIVGDTEFLWPGGAKPEFIATNGVRGKILTDILPEFTELPPRFRGVYFSGMGADYPGYVTRFNAAFGAAPGPGVDSHYAYDAMYALMYGQLAGEVAGGPIKGGSDLARGIRLLTPPGIAIKTGTDEIKKAEETLLKYGNGDFVGVTGPLDWDIRNGDPAQDITTWCAAIAAGKGVTKDTAQKFSFATGQLSGAATCPP
jgi:hypothetical protein